MCNTQQKWTKKFKTNSNPTKKKNKHVSMYFLWIKSTELYFFKDKIP